MSILGVQCLEEFIVLSPELAPTIWQINPEYGHSFGCPDPGSFDEIDFPTSHPTECHGGSVTGRHPAQLGLG